MRSRERVDAESKVRSSFPLFPSFCLLREHTPAAEHAPSSSGSVSEARKRENAHDSFSRGSEPRVFFSPRSFSPSFRFPLAVPSRNGKSNPRLASRHTRTRSNSPCTPTGTLPHRRRRRRRQSSEVRRRWAPSPSRLSTTKMAASACPGGSASASAGSPRRGHGVIAPEGSCGAAVKRCGAWPARRGRFGAFLLSRFSFFFLRCDRQGSERRLRPGAHKTKSASPIDKSEERKHRSSSLFFSSRALPFSSLPCFSEPKKAPTR